jgi:hypothetical protein
VHEQQTAAVESLQCTDRLTLLVQEVQLPSYYKHLGQINASAPASRDTAACSSLADGPAGCEAPMYGPENAPLHGQPAGEHALYADERPGLGSLPHTAQGELHLAGSFLCTLLAADALDLAVPLCSAIHWRETHAVFDVLCAGLLRSS